MADESPDLGWSQILSDYSQGEQSKIKQLIEEDEGQRAKMMQELSQSLSGQAQIIGQVGGGKGSMFNTIAQPSGIV